MTGCRGVAWTCRYEIEKVKAQLDLSSKGHKGSILQVCSQRSSEKMWALGEWWETAEGGMTQRRLKYSTLTHIYPTLVFTGKINPITVCEEEGGLSLKATGDRLWKEDGKGKQRIRGALGCLAHVLGKIVNNVPHVMRQRIPSANLRMTLN